MKRVAGAFLLLTLLSGCRSTQHRAEKNTYSDSENASKTPWGPAFKPTTDPKPEKASPLDRLPAVEDAPRSSVPPDQPKLPGVERRETSSGETKPATPNEDKNSLKLPGFSNVQPQAPAEKASELPRPPAKEPDVLWFDNNLILINYDVKDVGPSGIGGVDLWYKEKGKDWTKVEISSHEKSPYVVEVKEEGVYGFTLVASNSDGRSLPPPQADDPPQFWATVDTTKPTVKLIAAEGISSAEGRKILLSWEAADKNLPPEAVSLLYATREEGPWAPFASQLDNRGSFLWEVPACLTHCVFVRVRAVDRGGNIGFAQPRDAIFADRSRPRVGIVSVEAPGRGEDTRAGLNQTVAAPSNPGARPNRFHRPQPRSFPTVTVQQPVPPQPLSAAAKTASKPVMPFIKNGSEAKPAADPVAIDRLMDDLGRPIGLEVKRPVNASGT